MASPSVPIVPSTATRGTARRGTTKQRNPAARGSQSSTWITPPPPLAVGIVGLPAICAEIRQSQTGGGRSFSLARNEEVEPQGGEAPDQKQRVRAATDRGRRGPEIGRA